ncbi:GNAT family N-acetyltransferase [soil metagenome]
MSISIVQDVSKISRSEWDDFVWNHPQGNYFQSAVAFDLFKSIPAYLPMVFAAVDTEDQKIKGILLAVVQKEGKGVVGKFTARAIVWGGPLVKNEDPSIAEMILSAYDQTASEHAIYSQFRNLSDLTFAKKAFTNNGFEFLEHLNFLVPTSTIDSVQKLVSKSKIRQIKKGLSSGASIVEATTLEEVKEFYVLLKILYRTKVKKPLPDWIFFEDFFRVSCKNGLGTYLLIKENDKVIGGIMCPITPGKAIYEWYIAGDDLHSKHLYPSILATWAAIEYGCTHQLDHFDFLGAGKPDQDYGVREFKAKFGGTEMNFGRFEKVHKPLLMSIGKTGIALLKHMKR